jgi:hypothetical protein
MVHPEEFESPASAFGGQRSIQLSYGCICGAVSRTVSRSPVLFDRDANRRRFTCRLNLGQGCNRRCAIARYMDKLAFTNSVQG